MCCCVIEAGLQQHDFAASEVSCRTLLIYQAQANYWISAACMCTTELTCIFYLEITRKLCFSEYKGKLSLVMLKGTKI